MSASSYTRQAIRRLFYLNSEFNISLFSKIFYNNQEITNNINFPNELTNRIPVIESQINDPEFLTNINPTFTMNGKQYFDEGNTPEQIIALKLAASDIMVSTSNKQSDRYSITQQLKGMLKNSYPYHIIRTDIVSCFESIRHDHLQTIIFNDERLNVTTRKIVLKTIQDYKIAVNSQQGVPRGTSIGSVLAEYYLSFIDEEIKRIPRVIFYRRYVDDIVIVFCNNHSREIYRSRRELANLLRKFELEMHVKKTKTFLVNMLDNSNDQFDFLGYKYQFTNNHLALTMSSKKQSRYMDKIKIAFEEYERQILRNDNHAKNMLKKRLNYLSSNRYIVKSKISIPVGIYFSNRLADNTDFLQLFDERVNQLKNQSASLQNVQDLCSHTFEEGFNNRVFSKCSKDSIESIKSIWSGVR